MIENSAMLNRLSMEQVLVAPERASWFDGNMRGLMGQTKLVELMQSNDADQDRMSADDDFWFPSDDWRSQYRPYNVKQGVLQIPVMGVLLNRLAYQFGEYATGYQYIEKAFFRGLRDAEVRGIAFVHNSPGGEVAGNFELVDKIYDNRGVKPIRSFVRDHSYSASYSLASAADEIVMTRTGGVGSIGVVTSHMDWSKYMEKLGVQITFIHAPEGGHKVDGNPYEALGADVKARIQKRITKIYGIFVSTVARNRDMSEDDVRATKAGTFDSDEAIENGLANSVGVFEESLEAFVNELETGDETMAVDDTKNTVAQADHDAAVTAARAEGKAEGKAEGVKEGATAENARISGILASDAGKDRPKAALHTALNSDMTVEKATAFLSGLDAEKAVVTTTDDKSKDKPKDKAKGSHFDDAMSADTPDVGGGDDDDDQDKGEGGESASLLSAYGAATGRDFNKPKK